MPRGFNTAADAIRTTVDGVDTNTIWAEFIQTLNLRNADRDSLVGFLTYRTTAAGDEIVQARDTDDVFEAASEFGVPQSLRTGADVLQVGFGLKDFDAASRFTWRFLRDADANQVEAAHQTMLDADNRSVFKAVFGALLNNAERTNPELLKIKPLYNADGIVPPTWAGQSFDGTHTHYLVSGAATVDGQDLVDLAKHVTHHGYGDVSRGERVIVFMHPSQGETVRGLQKGVNSPLDSIPSESAPAYLTDLSLVGDRAPATLGRLPIFGSIGATWLSEHPLIPAGYLLAVATSGPNGTSNVVAFREHVRPEYQGLRLLGGSSADYPLTSAYYQRSFGTGVARRGAAAVMQIKTTGSYVVPTEYATVLA